MLWHILIYHAEDSRFSCGFTTATNVAARAGVKTYVTHSAINTILQQNVAASSRFGQEEKRSAVGVTDLARFVLYPLQHVVPGKICRRVRIFFSKESMP